VGRRGKGRAGGYSREARPWEKPGPTGGGPPVQRLQPHKPQRYAWRPALSRTEIAADDGARFAIVLAEMTAHLRDTRSAGAWSDFRGAKGCPGAEYPIARKCRLPSHSR